MQILISPEGVLVEMMELACLRIAQTLRVPPQSVMARIHPGGRPEFGVNPEIARGLNPEEIKSVIQVVWRMHIEPILRLRLSLVNRRRRGSAKEEKASAPKEGRGQEEAGQEGPGEEAEGPSQEE